MGSKTGKIHWNSDLLQLLDLLLNILICICRENVRFYERARNNPVVFFCFYTNKICMQALEAGKKEEKKGRTFMFSRSTLIYQSWFTAPYKNLERRLETSFPNGECWMELLWSTQESDVHYNWLRDAASAWEVRLHAPPALWESFCSGTLALIQDLWKSI